ncbi:MAG TPA: NAD(P)H-dependent oxidoreductase subunit E [Anaerolineales bacterium]|nr:NAD(P)H-dependent oxidoreductase subunit E [Anaerolineales bacterium]
MLAEKYPTQIEKILSRYPADQKRSAVMYLLYLAQSDEGYVSQAAMDEIAQICEIEPTQVAAIVGFYTLYYDKKEGKNRIQICTDLPCALRGAEGFAKQVCDHLGVKMGGTTPDGKITVEHVMCLAACDRAPMFQLQNADGIAYHENQTIETAKDLIAKLQAEG